MQIVLVGKNIEITSALKAYAERKISKIEKFFDSPLSQPAQVAMSVQRGRHIVEVTIPVNGMLLRGEEQSDDMYSSIDSVVEKLERQIDKYKGRLQKKRPAGARVAETAGQELPEPDRVVKVKRFPVKPMSVDEAIMQMNLLGHDFFVFHDTETSHMAVVYRRRDGNYGLIEPEE